MFDFGVKRVVAFLNHQENFADFSLIKFPYFNKIVEKLLIHTNDYPQFHINDAGIKQKSISC